MADAKKKEEPQFKMPVAPGRGALDGLRKDLKRAKEDGGIQLGPPAKMTGWTDPRAFLAKKPW